MGYQRTAFIDAGYDHRDEPGSNGGAHALGFRFALISDDGNTAITWRFNTGLMRRPLRSFHRYGVGAQDRRDKPGLDAQVRDLYPSSAMPVVLHSHEQRNDWGGGQECDLIGGLCYGDMGYTVGDQVLETCFDPNPDAMWNALEAILVDWTKPVTL